MYGMCSLANVTNTARVLKRNVFTFFFLFNVHRSTKGASNLFSFSF
jgi:hypothetical protein